MVEVLACNWDALAVYQLCAPEVAVGMAVIWLGVSAGEIHAACLLRGLPAERWPDVAEGVNHMGEVAASCLNKRAQRGTPRRAR